MTFAVPPPDDGAPMVVGCEAGSPGGIEGPVICAFVLGNPKKLQKEEPVEVDAPEPDAAVLVLTLVGAGKRLLKPPTPFTRAPEL
jgi:hypothetical protein